MKLHPKQLAYAAALAITLSACGSDSGGAHGLSANDLWARPTAPAATTAAIYGEFANETDGLLNFKDAYSTSCDRIELHRSSEVDGVMTMSPADGTDQTISPGESMTLAPLALHLMCIGLPAPLAEGETFELEVTFEGAGVSIDTVSVEQR